MDNNLDALIAHYNDIQIRIENYNTKASNNVIVIITLVCAILGTNLLAIDKGYKTIFFIVPKYFWTNRLSAPVFSLFVFLPNIYVFYSLFFQRALMMKE